jgi:Response regulators consisting of a CheY-like receiver domain and a winged-helix DNA-binding domain
MNGRILVVEDNVQFQSLISRALSYAGYEVILASDGAEGLNRLRETRPHLVILDIMLPGMDGYEVCRHIRANPQTADIPVLMLTAKSGPRDQMQGFESGADDYLTKDMSLLEIIQRIKSMLFFTSA